jgi:hypothetical protein
MAGRDRLQGSLDPVKVYETSDIRNVALIGHGHSGKTSLAAGLLYTTGATSRLLRVDEGASVTDFDDEEIARKITISTAVAAAEWNRKKMNLLDTPGFNIFINDTRASLAAADSAFVLVDGVAGVEVQTGCGPSARLPASRAMSSSWIASAQASSAPSKAYSRSLAALPFRFTCQSGPRKTLRA